MRYIFIDDDVPGVYLGKLLFYNVVNKSYAHMFTINASLLFLAIIYSTLNLKWRTTSLQEPLAGKNVLLDFFDKKHVVMTVKTLTKSRGGSGRLHIWLVLFAMMFYVFQRDENSKSYLYMELVFKWGLDNYSDWKVFKSMLFALGRRVQVGM